MMPGGRPVRWEDSSLAVGVASILLPSAAEGSCPVELGNPPILALILLRHKGCTVLRLRYQKHQCGALKSQGMLLVHQGLLILGFHEAPQWPSEIAPKIPQSWRLHKRQAFSEPLKDDQTSGTLVHSFPLPGPLEAFM